jgi:hypothetical protein
MSDYIDLLREQSERQQRLEDADAYTRQINAEARARAEQQRAEIRRRGQEADTLFRDETLARFMGEMRDGWVTKALRDADPKVREDARLKAEVVFIIYDELQERIETLRMQRHADVTGVIHE